MSTPIPREVLAVIEAQQAALAKVAPKHRARLLAIALEVQRALEARLEALAPERYTTQEVRVVLTQVRAVVEILGVEMGKRMGKELRKIGEVAAGIGRDGLIAQIDAWADKFQGSVRRIAPAEVAGDLLDEGLLEYYESSRQTYGLEAIAKMRGALAKSVLEGKTVSQASEALTSAIELQDWRAERIVRTEQSFSLHRRQVLDLIDMFGDEAEGWGKTLIAVHDDRTGQDSLFVDGQVRKLMEEFWDGRRRYQHPPNRPNDRETLGYVPPEALKDAIMGSNRRIRAEYHDDLSKIASAVGDLATHGGDLQAQAKLAHRLRKEARIRARARMDPSQIDSLRERDRQKYGSPDGPEFEQLVEKYRAGGYADDEVYRRIIEASQRTSKEFDELAGKP